MRVALRGHWRCMAEQASDHGKTKSGVGANARISMSQIMDADILKLCRRSNVIPWALQIVTRFAVVRGITLVLTAFFIVEGVSQIVASLSYREVFPDSWGWMLASGIADLILAALIIKGWPSTATWALGLIVGINLITSGAAIIMVALAGRTLVKTLAHASR